MPAQIKKITNSTLRRVKMEMTLFPSSSLHRQTDMQTIWSRAAKKSKDTEEQRRVSQMLLYKSTRSKATSNGLL